MLSYRIICFSAMPILLYGSWAFHPKRYLYHLQQVQVVHSQKYNDKLTYAVMVLTKKSEH